MFRHGLLSHKFNKQTHKKTANGSFPYINSNAMQVNIVKGYEPSHRPWMTFIQIRKDNSRFQCGGSIISNYWILSAGHCFCEQLKCKPTKRGNLIIDYNPQEHVQIITGLKDLDQINSKETYQRSTPQQIIIHPL